METAKPVQVIMRACAAVDVDRAAIAAKAINVLAISFVLAHYGWLIAPRNEVIRKKQKKKKPSPEL